LTGWLGAYTISGVPYSSTGKGRLVRWRFTTPGMHPAVLCTSSEIALNADKTVDPEVCDHYNPNGPAGSMDPADEGSDTPATLPPRPGGGLTCISLGEGCDPSFQQGGPCCDSQATCERSGCGSAYACCLPSGAACRAHCHCCENPNYYITSQCVDGFCR
jgi:hypothetical protein